MHFEWLAANRHYATLRASRFSFQEQWLFT